LYAQAIQYANKNFHNEDLYVIANMGPYFSFGTFVTDFHTTNGYDRRFVLFDGYIGSQVHEDLSVKAIPIKNEFPLQHKLYKAGLSVEDNRCIMQCLYNMKMRLKLNEIRKIDLGPKFILDSVGGLVEKQTEPLKEVRFIADGNGIIQDRLSEKSIKSSGLDKAALPIRDKKSRLS